jgi:hypothetical protein
VSRLSRKCGTLNVSQPYGPPRPVTGTALHFFNRIMQASASLWIYCQQPSCVSEPWDRQSTLRTTKVLPWNQKPHIHWAHIFWVRETLIWYLTSTRWLLHVASDAFSNLCGPDVVASLGLPQPLRRWPLDGRSSAAGEPRSRSTIYRMLQIGRCSRNTLDSCWRGSRIESLQKHRLSWLRFFANAENVPRLSHDHFCPDPLQLTIHSDILRYIGLILRASISNLYTLKVGNFMTSKATVSFRRKDLVTWSLIGE